MIVLADADLERAANAAVYYSMQNGGQTCISIERVYVEAPVYDEFVAQVSEKVARAAPGRARRPGHGRRRRDHVPAAARHRRAPRRRRRRQGRAACWPAATRAPGAGHFYEPTVLVDVDHTMTCMTEETFGPTLPIMKVADAEEAIRLANDSPYGLGASVFTTRHRARRGDRPADRGRRGRASTTRSSTTSRSSCRWAAGRRPGSASRHGAGGHPQVLRASRRSLVTPRSRSSATRTCSPTRRAPRGCSRGVFKFLYGRGKRD